MFEFICGDLITRASDWERLSSIVIDSVEYIPAAEGAQVVADLAVMSLVRVQMICASTIFSLVILVWAAQLLVLFVKYRRSLKKRHGGEINV